MTFGQRTRRRTPAISVVSMADLAFLLMVFFMVTTSFTRGPQLEVQLPAAETGRPPLLPNAVTISISRAGLYEVDGRPTEADQLILALAPRLQGLREPVVVIAADKGVAWDRVVQAMDVARGLGVVQLELSVTEPAP